MADFFHANLSNNTAGNADSDPFAKLFAQVFSKSLTLINQSFDGFLASSSDGFAMLLMIQMAKEFRKILNTRKIPCLDFYFDELLDRLWPKFNDLLVKNMESVVSANPQAMFTSERVSQTTAKRYAEFTSAAYIISKDACAKVCDKQL